MMSYRERINRYRVVKHEERPDAHKAEMRINGIDPDTTWSLVWSFETLAAAEKQLAKEIKNAAPWETWKIVDAGAAEIVDRPSWFGSPDDLSF